MGGGRRVARLRYRGKGDSARLRYRRPQLRCASLLSTHAVSNAAVFPFNFDVPPGFDDVRPGEGSGGTEIFPAFRHPDLKQACLTGTSTKTPITAVAYLLEGEQTMPPVELHPNLDQFHSIAVSDVKSSGYASRNRVYYSVSEDKPVLAGFFKRGSKIGPEYYQENAHAVHMFERAIIEQSGAKEANKTIALWYLSKFHQGAAPLYTRDVVTVFRLLSANEHVLSFYISLQSLADVISSDPAFIYLIKHVDPGKLEKVKQVTYKDWAVKEGYSTGEWQGSFSGWKLLGNIAQLGTFAVPPVGIIKKLVDICSETDKLEAAKQICDLAEQFNAPIAYQMAQVIYDETWKCLTELGVAVTTKVLSIPLGVVAGPGGYSISSIPGLSILTTPATSIGNALGSIHLLTSHINLGQVVTLAPPYLVQFTLDKSLVEKVVKNINETILPVFAIRRDRQGTLKDAPNSGRDRVYSLYEKMTVIALISYLGIPLPSDFDLKVPEGHGEDKIKEWYRLQARVAFKNLLGSYAEEDCLRDIAYGMAEDEYIAEMLGAKDTNSVKFWHVDKAYRDNSSKRPISFLRFLCVCSGLVENHTVTAQDKKAGKDRVWDGLGPRLPGKRFVSQMKGNTMQPIFGKADREGDWERRQEHIWRAPQEAEFASLTEAEIKDHDRLLKRYRCMPAMGPEFVSSHIKDTQSKNKLRFSYSGPSDYPVLKTNVSLKHRWLRDKEEPTCRHCGVALGKTDRHHCRYCGGLFCSAHCKKNALNLVNVETGKWEGMRACDDCIRLFKGRTVKLGQKSIDLDNIGLREGDIIVRPVFRKESTKVVMKK